jgi:hypothetical protein
LAFAREMKLEPAGGLGNTKGTVMKRVLLFVAALVFVLGGCGGSDTRESLADDTMKVMDKYAAALGSVTDEASAKAAGEKIDALVPRMKKLSERSSALGKPTADQNAAMEKKYKPRLQKMMKWMMPAVFKIGMDPKLQQPLEGPMKRFGEAGKGAELDLGNS